MQSLKIRRLHLERVGINHGYCPILDLQLPVSHIYLPEQLSFPFLCPSMRLPSLSTYIFSLPLLALALTHSSSTPALKMTATATPTLYFAYGSNLSLTQMASRCPTSTYISLSRLSGWKWIIGERGYANVIPSPNPPHPLTLKGKPLPPANDTEEDHVIGMLYTLLPTDEEKLDLAEGVPFAYVKQMHDVSLLDGEGKETGERRKALVYVDVERTGEGVCKEEYVGRINRVCICALICFNPG